MGALSSLSPTMPTPTQSLSLWWSSHAILQEITSLVKSSSKTAPIYVTRSPRKAYREYRITGRCRSVSSAGHEERGCTKSKQQCCVQHVFSFTKSSTNAVGDFVQPDGENGRMCQPGLLPPSPNPS